MSNRVRTHHLCHMISLMVLAAVSRDSLAQVTAPVLETFESEQITALDGWHVVSGDWKIQGGSLVANSMNAEAYITFGDESWQNYVIETSVTFRQVRDPMRWLSVLVRATRNGERPWSQVPVRFDTTQPNGMEFAVRTAEDGWSIRSKGSATSATTLHQPRRLKVIVRGSRVDGFLDDQRVLSSQLCVDRPAGCVGLGASGCVAAFDDVSIRQLPPSPDSPIASSSTSDVVAHRGYSAVAPENTLAAIREAIAIGANGCEFDVYASRDKTVVLMHDETVDRTTDGKGRVTDMSVQQLRQLDAGSWKNSRYAGERIPTLTEALQLLKDTHCQAVIEIKMEGIAKEVLRDVRALDMVDKVAIIAFNQDVVREIRRLEPRVTVAWLCDTNLQGTPAERADWLKSQADKCKARLLDLRFTMLSPELIAELKRRELGVWTWTVNEAIVMQTLQKWGVDSITTDRPDLLRGKPR